jgi:hypothetical protein
VDTLWRLLRYYLKAEVPRLMRNNIRLNVIGRTEVLPLAAQHDLENAIELTRRNTGLQVNLAINYGGRTEIVDAVNRLLENARRTGELDSLHVDEELLADHLYTAHQPDPDLPIRTQGDAHQQFPAVADRLCRTVRDRYVLARFQAHRFTASHREYQVATALRRATRTESKQEAFRRALGPAHEAHLTALVLIPTVIYVIFSAHHYCSSWRGLLPCLFCGVRLDCRGNGFGAHHLVAPAWSFCLHRCRLAIVHCHVMVLPWAALPT